MHLDTWHHTSSSCGSILQCPWAHCLSFSGHRSDIHSREQCVRVDEIKTSDLFKIQTLGFPGGSVVKNLPANGWSQEFNPWPRRIPHATEQLSLCSTATEPVLWSSGAATTELMPQLLKPATREATEMRSLGTATGEWPPLAATREKPMQYQRLSTTKK